MENEEEESGCRAREPEEREKRMIKSNRRKGRRKNELQSLRREVE